MASTSSTAPLARAGPPGLSDRRNQGGKCARRPLPTAPVGGQTHEPGRDAFLLAICQRAGPLVRPVQRLGTGPCGVCGCKYRPTGLWLQTQGLQGAGGAHTLPPRTRRFRAALRQHRPSHRARWHHRVLRGLAVSRVRAAWARPVARAHRYPLAQRPGQHGQGSVRRGHGIGPIQLPLPGWPLRARPVRGRGAGHRVAPAGRGLRKLAFQSDLSPKTGAVAPNGLAYITDENGQVWKGRDEEWRCRLRPEMSRPAQNNRASIEMTGTQERGN